ncbi:TerC/Alx family metal homeostasis membrane protein [Ruminiclostridium cellobioparum]|uniref:Integral membrane protein, TerC family n=1 Tax=Ruminiclostridium cellobioparum subsp. termitidis CT1112 TaxID=1195236 RepID=S0FK67_RUMCE|nr:TerC/Alx family metal homeostasis membrane protein [Ruminiclostridium cellobioparum]EMS69559.1 integral membrane protein, TerC family [Ruminiclostridium cellobioparum subsp. termitidis CT1112]
MSTKRAIKFVLLWIGLAILFNAGVYVIEGQHKALEFLGGYMIELSLSVDNLFLFLILFTSFGIKPQYQRRVLNYGILGAIVLRLIFILLGITIINKIHWILYVFGIILIISGAKMMLSKDEAGDHKDSKVLKLLGKVLPVTDTMHEEKFFVKVNHVLHATPLFAILVLIEFSDILFAIDSIPAIFSISRDPFIVYTSNIFAILGLRSLYFVLAAMQEKFKYVKYGVALILMFTGVKLGIMFWHKEIPIIYSLLTIFTILLGSVIVSILINKHQEKKKEKVKLKKVDL